MQKICTRCCIEKDIEEFTFKRREKDQRSSNCKTCTRALSKSHYLKNKQYYVDKADCLNKETLSRNREFIINYLKSHPCVDCGNDNVLVLEFDHVKGKKISPVSTMMIRSLNTIQAEIAKCEVRCANCHKIKTAKQFGYWKLTH